MVIYTDQDGNVRLVGHGDIGGDAMIWNGLTLTKTVLTDQQEASYNALPTEGRIGVVFDGQGFSAVFPDPAVVAREKAAAMAISNGAELRRRQFDKLAASNPSAALQTLRGLIQ